MRNRLEARNIELGVVREATGMDFLSYDPFSSALALSGLANRTWSASAYKASLRQVAILEGYGVAPDESRGYTKKLADEMVNLLYHRYVKDMAPLPQVRELVLMGYSREEAWSMTRHEARGTIERHRWRSRGA
jgi:hypothetical protein